MKSRADRVSERSTRTRNEFNIGTPCTSIDCQEREAVRNGPCGKGSICQPCSHTRKEVGGRGRRREERQLQNTSRVVVAVVHTNKILLKKSQIPTTSKYVANHRPERAGLLIGLEIGREREEVGAGQRRPLINTANKDKDMIVCCAQHPRRSFSFCRCLLLRIAMAAWRGWTAVQVAPNCIRT